MITRAEADMEAARLLLPVVHDLNNSGYVAAAFPPEDVKVMTAAFKAIEQWLRRRALGGDKIAIRQLERELGRQVKLRGGK